MLVEKINSPLAVSKFWKRLLAGAIATTGAGLTIVAIWSNDFKEATISKEIGINEIGKAFLNYGDKGYILPFEVISILLLAAMVGAIVIAKTKKVKESN
jgi:NADH-quinone oxidoreductase subunit J